MTRPRKLLLAVGAVVLAGFAFVAVVFLAGEREMRAFCDALAAGASAEEVRGRAQAQGLRMTPVPDQEGKEDKAAYIHDPGAFGRSVCEATFRGGRLASARFLNND